MVAVLVVLALVSGGTLGIFLAGLSVGVRVAKGEKPVELPTLTILSRKAPEKTKQPKPQENP